MAKFSSSVRTESKSPHPNFKSKLFKILIQLPHLYSEIFLTSKSIYAFAVTAASLFRLVSGPRTFIKSKFQGIGNLGRIYLFLQWVILPDQVEIVKSCPAPLLSKGYEQRLLKTSFVPITPELPHYID